MLALVTLALTTMGPATARTTGASSTLQALSFPLRGAFYYPWFPETWTVGGSHVFYHPALGYYDSSSASVADAHIRALDRANIDVAIASWWGVGRQSESTRIPLLLDRTRALGSPLRWALYYEGEGSGDPSVSQIQSDLAYVLAEYAGRPEYARVGGKPVVFVYAADDLTCEVADRWEQASAGGWHVVLKVFSGYRSCVNQPDSWHQYAGATATDRQSGHSFTISPGFWHAAESGPRLVRDPARWRQNVRDMVVSGEPWQLVVSFNEWGEGTAVEEAAEWGTTYLDALANDGADPSPPSPPAPPSNSVTFAAVGDLGANSRSEATLRAIDASGAEFATLLGDASYDEVVPESAWCAWVYALLPIGLELVAGNHEEDTRVDGFIRAFSSCMPSRMGAVGDYGTEYHLDRGALRLIMISPSLTVDGVRYDYRPGNSHYAWLRDRIREAKVAGKRVIVGMHKVCLSAGNKSCEIGDALQDLLISENVDLVLQGHDHDYQRLAQLRCANPGVYEPACVADDGKDGVYGGQGTVFVITGSGGRSLTSINTSDSEYPYVAAWLGGNSPNRGQGFLKLTVSSTEIRGEFVGSTTTFTDSFVITSAAEPPPQPGDTTPPSKPAGLAAVAVSAGQVDLTWDAASDDVGVTGYDVVRDGSVLATVGTVTTYRDTSVASSTSYAYRVAARDAAGNVSPQSDPAVVTTPASSELTFAPSGDTSVRADKPTGNYGTATALNVDNSPVKHTLLKFAVSGVGGRTVTSAKLLLHCLDESSAGGQFRGLANPTASWAENSVTWNSAPAAGSSVVASLGSVLPGRWYEVDVTALVRGDGTVSLRITSPSSNGADYASRERGSQFAPKLVVRVS
jgi:hypothetical protein